MHAAELIASLVAGASSAVAVTLIVGLSAIAVILIEGVSITLLQNIQEQLLNKRLIILYKFVFVEHARRKNDRVYKKAISSKFEGLTESVSASMLCALNVSKAVCSSCLYSCSS